MPNLAATVGAGATALCPGAHATAAHLAQARAIFEAVGIVEQVGEKLMDAVTGLSGTGPMYVFHLVEAMADAGVKVGLSRDVATRLAMQTVIGSAQLAQASHLHPAALKDQVTSPGGTAIAALHVLRREGFQAIVMDAVEAATKRSAELGQ
jgi:pyrroline-5-carboxylate reductase